ncbi:MAG: 16S rRNA (cytidine(1402)-2'-O)-methyltransferase [Oscillospiraceae bacterium]|nr:16S rRNA (cytidine(1402)-2'-O)-methyltransferase [Oscillospiraceae bacterium]
MAGKLFVTGTPIGNLSDFSKRAIETLENCDFIAAEDTRVTLKLLNHFDIKKPLISYYEHNKLHRGEEIINRIINGENCVLVTDAGMPAISDPGMELVNDCHDNGITVVSIPGPTAFATALAISGMESGRFTFEGFLSVNKPSRREHLNEVKTEKRTMIFYEAPHKLSQTLRDMLETFGDRNIAIVRELTKIHEEVIRTTLQKAVEDYPSNNLKGELVLIIEGAKEEQKDELTLKDAVLVAREFLGAGMSVNDASKMAAKQTGIKKSDIYKELSNL